MTEPVKPSLLDSIAPTAAPAGTVSNAANPSVDQGLFAIMLAAMVPPNLTNAQATAAPTTTKTFGEMLAGGIIYPPGESQVVSAATILPPTIVTTPATVPTPVVTAPTTTSTYISNDGAGEQLIPPVTLIQPNTAAPVEGMAKQVVTGLNTVANTTEAAAVTATTPSAASIVDPALALLADDTTPAVPAGETIPVPVTAPANPAPVTNSLINAAAVTNTITAPANTPAPTPSNGTLPGAAAASAATAVNVPNNEAAANLPEAAIAERQTSAASILTGLVAKPGVEQVKVERNLRGGGVRVGHSAVSLQAEQRLSGDVRPNLAEIMHRAMNDSVTTQPITPVTATPFNASTADNPETNNLLTPLGIAPTKADGTQTHQAGLTPARTATPPSPFEQILQQVKAGVANGQDRITVKLQPVELGKVEIKLDTGADGQTRMMLSAERPETLELLQRDAKQLETILKDAGLKADSGSLSFNLQQQHHHEQASGGGTFSDHGAASADANSNLASNLQDEQRPTLSLHEGVADIVV